MRPTLLKMKAFGSYAEETKVEFDRLTHGPYLIVGKTGAGKTTIFDAISFALFGRPSGSERKVDMLHSDFVPLSEDTLVKLDFVHQGRAYHVERSLHFSKKRGGEGYNDAKIEASMTEDGQPAIQGATKVTERCEELLGLNAEQFRRIVMLAQGEFREFLRANSDKKNEILGKLFDNSEYVRFQNLLASARDSLRQQRKDRETEISTVMHTLFKLPEDMTEQDAEDYLPGHPRLVENLQALVQREQARLEQLELEHAQRSNEVEELMRREGAAEADNAQLDKLDKLRGHRAELEAQQKHFDVRKKAYLAAERALHRVTPWEKEASQAAEAVRQTRTGISEQTERMEKQRETLTAAQAAVEADAPKKVLAESLYGEAAKLEAALPRYGEAAEKKSALEKTQSELDSAKDLVRQQEEKKTALAGELTEIQAELTGLEGCEAEEVRLGNERDTAKERRDAVSIPKDGISDRVKAILTEEKALEADCDTLGRLTKDASEAEAGYHILYQAFLEGQAGLIAADMEKELAETGRTVCPVCSTPFCRDDAHRFALPTERIPDKTEVDRAAENAKAAEDKRQKLQAEIKRQSSLLEQQKDSVLRSTQKLEPGCADWDTLTAPGWLPDLCSRLEQALREKENAYAEARVKCSRRKKLQKDKTEKTTEQEKLEKKLTEARSEREALERKLHGLQSAVEEIKKQLPYPTEKEARAKLAALTQERNALKTELEAHETALKKAKEDLNLTEGGLKTLQNELPTQEQAAGMAEAALRQVLAENGFADLVAAREALSPIGSADGEEWLQQEKEMLDDHDRELENTCVQIRDLEEQTAGKARIDLTELQTQLAEAKANQSAAADAQKAQSNLLEGHQLVFEKVGVARKVLAGTDRAFKRINRLAELAVGTNSEGGKLSFDRYVMGAIFREVLEMANRRLNIMTGGRFELIHSVDAGRKNAAAGLEIEVLDVTVGKQRASASISGGEGFMVALSLALGLSDVVQNHAGGQRLDTLFIDEGFGTLDDGKLDNVITVLNQLTEGNRLVGIISHVDKLEESIPQKVRVTSTDRGSTLTIELS